MKPFMWSRVVKVCQGGQPSYLAFKGMEDLLVYEETMLEVLPAIQHQHFPLFDPRSIIASGVTLTLNANKLAYDEMKDYALKANSVRELFYQRAL